VVTTRLRFPASAFLVAALCPLLAGCSFAYPFEVSGFARSAATGKPLAWVKIFSTHISSDRSPGGLVPGEDRPVATTGADGSFSFSESVRDVHFMQGGGTRWVLLFAREGFKREEVDLRTVRRPSSAKVTTPVFVVLYLTEEKAQR
jgi:hypothetical protein